MVRSLIASLRANFSILRGNILVLSLSTVLGQFSRSMVFPYASLYILALGGNPQQVGFVNALAPLLGLILFPIGGYLADHTSRVNLIAYSTFASGSVVLLYVIAPSWQLIALAMLLQGIMTIQFPARSALVADSLAPQDRGRGVGAMSTLSSIFAIIAPYVAGLVVDAYGPNLGIRALYAVMMLFYLASGWVQARFLTETITVPQDSIRWRSLPQVVLNVYRDAPGLWRRLPTAMRAISGVIALGFMANGVVSAFWVVYAVEEIGLSPSAWGLILLLETTVRTLAFLPGGMLVDRWGRTRILVFTLILGLVAFPGFILAHGFGAVLLTRLLIAVSHGLAIPANTALIADTIPRNIRGQVMAAIGQGGLMLGAAGGGTGGPSGGYLMTLPLMAASLLGGILYSVNPTYPWIFITGTTVLSLILALIWIRDPGQAEV